TLPAQEGHDDEYWEALLPKKTPSFFSIAFLRVFLGFSYTSLLLIIFFSLSLSTAGRSSTSPYHACGRHIHYLA
ncbi:MAG: hypothetical protein R3183_14440, partial [Oleiphilaceae bacterium]|nr:hypothetical protein [Oleiphilaceae bacterium]